MALVMASVSYKNASVDLREALALDGRLEQGYAQLLAHEAVDEAVLLSTCNRVEAYVSSPAPEAAAQRLRAFFEGLAPGRAAQTRKALVQGQDDETLWHLLQVASSLDSMVLGEAQILGQVKQAYEAGVQAGAVGPVFHGLFQRVFAAAKQVRSETEIGKHPASVPSVAVQLAGRVFSDLAGHQILILGAGEMAELCAEHLVSAGAASPVFCNRSLPKAKELAKRFKGQAHGLDALPSLLAAADVVLCSSGAPDYLLRAPEVEAALAERGRPQLLIDISVPRNIDPAVASLEAAYLYNLDDLDRLAGEHRAKRLAASREAEVLLKHRLRDLREWMAVARIAPTVKRLSGHFEALRSGELKKAEAKLKHLSPQDRQAVEALTKALTAKLLHTPLSRLKQQAGTGAKASVLVQGVEQLFGLDPEDAE